MREFKAGDRVIFASETSKPEHGRIERTLPRVVIVEFDQSPGYFFQVSRKYLKLESEEE